MPLIQIQDQRHTTPIKPKFALLALGFRPFFLIGTLFASIILLIWMLVLSSNSMAQIWQLPILPMWWHAHEMIFGFCVAIIAGFLLTAIQTWTGIPSIQGKSLLLLVIIWLFPRVGFLIFSIIPFWLSAIVDIIFLPLVALVIAQRIIKVKQWRNLPICMILLLLSVLNLANYMFLQQGNIPMSMYVLDATVFLIAILIVVIGTRVVPFFTERATQWQRPLVSSYPFKISCITLFLCAVFILLGWTSALQLSAGCAAISLLIHWYHMGWQASFKNPMLWSLHLALFFLPMGLALLALNYPFTAALHMITIGTITGIILAMIARISLGHTGRAIKSLKLMSMAFALVFIAAIFRILADIISPYYLEFIVISALLSIIAMLIFIVNYTKILLFSRADGKAG